MSGLVLELQRDALTETVDVSALLRKALVVSKKLNVLEIQDWINAELSGYTGEGAVIPSYRNIRGAVKAWNPYNGFIPLCFRDAKDAERFSTRYIGQSIGELDSIARQSDATDLRVPFSENIKSYLMSLMDIPFEPVLIVSATSVVGILEAVRTQVLNWALELEAKGVIGEGLTFSKNEKEVAASVVYEITNNIGSMSNSQLQQAASDSSQSQKNEIECGELKGFVETLVQVLPKLKLSTALNDEVRADVATLESQLTSPRPKENILRESLSSIRNVLEGITGSMLASELLMQMQKII